MPDGSTASAENETLPHKENYTHTLLMIYEVISLDTKNKIGIGGKQTHNTSAQYLQTVNIRHHYPRHAREVSPVNLHNLHTHFA